MNKIYVLWLCMNVIAAITMCEEKNTKLSQKLQKNVTFPLPKENLTQEYKKLLNSLDRTITSILNESANIAELHQLFTKEITEKQKKTILKNYFFIKIKQNNKKHVEFIITYLDSSLLKTTNKRGRTPLMAAIDNKANDVAHYLISQRSVDVNEVDHIGRTPLIEAINNMPDIVDYLLNRQADPNQADVTGITPLIAAINKNNINVVKSLVGLGAKVDQQDQKGNLPLVVAINNKASDIVKYLIKFAGAPLYQSDAQGTTPLLAAINIQDSTLVELLCSRGVSVGKQEFKAAQKTENLKIIRLLSQEIPRKKKSKFLFWRK